MSLYFTTVHLVGCHLPLTRMSSAALSCLSSSVACALSSLLLCASCKESQEEGGEGGEGSIVWKVLRATQLECSLLSSFVWIAFVLVKHLKLVCFCMLF